MVGSSRIVKHLKTKLLFRLKKRVVPPLPILGELQQELLGELQLLARAMPYWPFSAGENMLLRVKCRDVFGFYHIVTTRYLGPTPPLNPIR